MPEFTKFEEMSEKDSERLKKFLKELHVDGESGAEQRKKANEDMRFIYVPDGMWEGYLEDEYLDRVKLQFDITSSYKNRFIGNYNQTRVGVEFKPDDDATSDDDAETLTGLRNRDFRNNSGKLSQDYAVDEVAVCGYGCYKLAAAFEDEGDPENENQKEVYRPVYNAYASIIWDSSAKQINKRDARRCVELTEYTKDSFEEEFTGADPVSAYEPDDLGFYDYDEKEPGIYIASRYEIVKKKETVWVYHDLRAGKILSFNREQHEEKKAGLADDEFVEFIRKRKVTTQTVEKTVFSGKEILKKTKRIAGRYIPLIPIYGYRGFVNGVEWYKGLVRGIKDPQRVFNMQISQLAENTASSGQDKPIFDPDQMPPEIKALWADINNVPYLLAKTLRDGDGNIISAGPIGTLKAPALDQQVAQLMDMVLGYVQQATGGAPQDTMDPKSSGKAIQALLKRENLNTQDIMDNIANATEWEGTVYASIAEEIYSPRRAMKVLGKDGTETKRDISSLVMDEDQGRMVENNVLAGKRFQAHSDVGAPYETLREQKVEESKSILEAIKDTPAGEKYTPALLASIFMESTGPGSEILKKIARRDLISQGLIKPETDEEIAFAEQASQPKEDPQAELISAASEQALSEARERDSKALVNAADANKKQAETQKILEEIEREGFRTLIQVRESVLGNVKSLPL